jgi:hypothetical protein
MVLDQTEVKILKCGLVSDTHGVADQVCTQVLVTVRSPTIFDPNEVAIDTHEDV